MQISDMLCQYIFKKINPHLTREKDQNWLLIERDRTFLCHSQIDE